MEHSRRRCFACCPFRYRDGATITGEEISRHTLRFKNIEKETGFVASRSSEVLRNARIVFTVLFLVVFLNAVGTRSNLERYVVDPDSLQRQVAMLHWDLRVGAGLVIAAVDLGLMLPCCRGTSPRLREYIMALTLAFFCTVWTVSERYWLGKLSGNPVEIVFPGVLHTDSSAMLPALCVLLVSHVHIGLRWCTVFIVELACFIPLCAFTVIFGGPEGTGSIWHCIIVGTSVCMVASGKRRIERMERTMFLTILREKEARCAVEFKLSLMTDEQKRSSGKSKLLSEEKSSIAETVASDAVFNLFNEDLGLGVAERFVAVAKVGRREHWLIDKAQVAMDDGKKIGQGNFGIVVKGIYRGMNVAVKVPRKEGVRRWNNSLLCCTLNEIRIMRQVRHPNIVLFHGAIVDSTFLDVMLVLEMVHGVDLKTFVREISIMSDLEEQLCHRCDTIRMVCLAMNYLHSHTPCIIHGDLSPSNILVEKMHCGPRPKLLDFGLSRIISGRCLPLGGSLLWMAPELLSKPPPPPEPSADVYSFGCIAFFVATSLEPGGLVNPMVAFSEEVHEVEMRPLPWPSNGDPLVQCREVVDGCVEHNPDFRPTLPMVLASFHAWPSRQPEFKASTLSCSTEAFESMDTMRNHGSKMDVGSLHGLSEVSDCESLGNRDVEAGATEPTPRGSTCIGTSSSL